MESIDLNDNENINTSRKYWIIFKICNLVVSVISLLLGLSELFSRFDYFFQGILIIIISLLIIYLELINNPNPKIFVYASSFFTLLGRGLIYIIIGLLNLHGSKIRFILSILIILIGLSYSLLEFSNIEPPENLQGQEKWAINNNSINNNLDDFDIDNNENIV